MHLRQPFFQPAGYRGIAAFENGPVGGFRTREDALKGGYDGYRRYGEKKKDGEPRVKVNLAAQSESNYCSIKVGY